MPPKKKTRMISNVMQKGLLENQVQGNVSKIEKAKLSSHATLHNNHLKGIIPGGEGNTLKGQIRKPSILTTSYNHKKLPLSNLSGDQENASKSKNIESSILAPSNVHNLLSVPPGGQQNALKGQASKPPVLATSSNHKRLTLRSLPSGQENASKRKNTESSILAPSNVNNLLSVPPDLTGTGQGTRPSILATPSRHKRLFSGGQENASKSGNTEPSVLVPSSMHNKLPMGVLPGQGTRPSILATPSRHKRFFLDNLSGGQENASKGDNIQPSVLVPSFKHNKLPMGVHPGVRHNGHQMACHENQENNFFVHFDGQHIHVEERSPSLATRQNVLVNETCSPTLTPTVHNSREANCQNLMSNEVLDAVNSAEAELEYTLADASREGDRQIHLSREVLEAHYEEMNNHNSNSTTTTFPTKHTLRKTRGPTQETAVTPPKGKKWKCLIIDSQPVGQAASKLAIVLGLYARMEGYFPLHKQWKEQSPQSFKDVMKDIMRDYDFVDLEGIQANMSIVTHFCYESLKKKVRDWRFWLKTHYYIDGVSDQEVLKAPDKRITQKNWELLLKYWEREDKILEASRNKKNRGEDRATHTLGAKSIARHNYDEREKIGDGYTTLGAYVKAHQTKNGDYPDEYTRAMCEKVVATCVERDIANSSDPCVLSPILDIVYKGHHGGYERGRGLGWSRAMPWNKLGATISNDSVQHLTLELQNAKAEIEAMHMREKEKEARQMEQLEASKAREMEMQARMERMEALYLMQFSHGSVGGSTSPGGTIHSLLPR